MSVNGKKTCHTKDKVKYHILKLHLVRCLYYLMDNIDLYYLDQPLTIAIRL